MQEISSLTTIKYSSLVEEVENLVRKAFMQTVIIGLGNEQLGDQAIGVHAVRQLRESELPQTTKVIEFGTAALDTLFALKHAKRIIVLDSLKDGGTPGTVYKIPLKDYSGTPCIASMQNFKILQLMARIGSKRREPLSIVVFGMEPAGIGRSEVLSPLVAKSLPHFIEDVQKELRN